MRYTEESIEVGAVLIRVQGIRRSIDVGGATDEHLKSEGQIALWSKTQEKSRQFQELRIIGELKSSGATQIRNSNER